MQQLHLKPSQPGSPLAPQQLAKEAGPALDLALIKAHLQPGDAGQGQGQGQGQARWRGSASQSEVPLLAAGPQRSSSAPLAIGGLRRNLSGPLQQHLSPGSPLLRERCGAVVCLRCALPA